MLLHRVEDEDGVRKRLHLLDAAQVPLELLEFSRYEQGLLLGHGRELAGVAHALVLLHLADTLGDRLEVGEHAAQPALVHVGHSALLGEGLDGVLRLALGSNEQHATVVGHQVTGEPVGGFDPLKGLLKVNDVDTRPLAVDEPLHPRVPAAGLMSEVDTRFQQLLHGHDGHVVVSFPSVLLVPALRP